MYIGVVCIIVDYVIAFWLVMMDIYPPGSTQHKYTEERTAYVTRINKILHSQHYKSLHRPLLHPSSINCTLHLNLFQEAVTI
jgi:hypothetical protein